MIDYEDYTRFRDLRNLKDGDVAKLAKIPPSTFSDWKSGKSRPKADKIKIADALKIDYSVFIGPVGKFSTYNTKKGTVTIDIEADQSNRIKKALKLYEAYEQAVPEIQSAVDRILKP